MQRLACFADFEKTVGRWDSSGEFYETNLETGGSATSAELCEELICTQKPLRKTLRTSGEDTKSADISISVPVGTKCL